MDLKIIVKYAGQVLAVTAVALLIPCAYALLINSPDWTSFLAPAAISGGLWFLSRLIKVDSRAFFPKEGFALVALSWVLISLIGSLPFYLSREYPTYADCFFESVSGFTTTGATSIAVVESLTRPMLLWRNMTHLMGGMGILVFTLALAPAGRGYASHIVRAESSGTDFSKLVPKLSDSSKILYYIYIGIFLAFVILLSLGGMAFFDALLNSMTVASTGGFSITSQSIETYHSLTAEIIVGLGMIACAVNFALFYSFFKGNFVPVWQNDELRFFILVVALATAAIAVDLVYAGMYGPISSLRLAFFQTSSIITTTGLSTSDIGTWPSFTKTVLFALMFVGGCTGSTAGGIKVVRIVILLRAAKAEISKLMHPRAVTNIKINGKPLADEAVRSVLVFFAIYIFVFAGATLIVSVDGFPYETNMGAVAATLNNVGLSFGFGEGCSGFYQYSSFSKYVFSACMLIGRLEIYPVLFILAPGTWKAFFARSNVRV